MSDGLLPTQAVLNQMASPETLEGEDHWHSVTVEARVHNPHRDPNVLQQAWVRSDTTAEVARRLGCGQSAAAVWLEVYGYRQKATEEHGLGLAQRMRAADDPAEVLADD